MFDVYTGDKSPDGKKSLDISMESNATTLTGIEIVGTRSLKRSSTETPVPVDIIPISNILPFTVTIFISIFKFKKPNPSLKFVPLRSTGRAKARPLTKR